MKAIAAVMKKALLLAGIHSEKQVVTMGMHAPSPIPDSTRNAAKNSQLGAK